MNIRRITSDHYLDLYNLRLEALRRHPTAFSSAAEFTESRGADAFRHTIPTGAIFLSYNSTDQATGMVGVQQKKGIKLRHKAYIWGMYVSPEDRKAGAGLALMQNAIRFARTNGTIERINLSVNSTNLAAKKLYKKLGFRSYGKEEASMKVDSIYHSEDLLVLVL